MMRLREGLFLLAGALSSVPLLAQNSIPSEQDAAVVDEEAGQDEVSQPTRTEADDLSKKQVEEQTAADVTVIRRRPSTIFAFGVGKLQDIGEYDLYERLYGKPKNMMILQTGYYLYSNYVDVGFSAKFGYYNAKGHPLTTLDGLNVPVEGNLPETAVIDHDQSVELSLIPVQALLELAYSPFPVSRRITFRGWIGPEFLFVQEVLKPNLPSTSNVPEGASLVSKGWNQGLVTGAMVSISITGIESRSDYALKSIGVDRTYISPFLEIVKTTNDKMGNFDRKVYGINITFEGLR